MEGMSSMFPSESLKNLSPFTSPSLTSQCLRRKPLAVHVMLDAWRSGCYYADENQLVVVPLVRMSPKATDEQSWTTGSLANDC